MAISVADFDLKNAEIGFQVLLHNHPIASFRSITTAQFEEIFAPNERFVRRFVLQAIDDYGALDERELDRLCLGLTLHLMRDRDRSGYPLKITAYDFRYNSTRSVIRRLCTEICLGDVGRATELGARLARISAEEYSSWCAHEDHLRDMW